MTNAKITREELLKLLWSMRGGDPETDHANADALLLEYIDDEEITRAFEALERWYA